MNQHVTKCDQIHKTNVTKCDQIENNKSPISENQQSCRIWPKHCQTVRQHSFMRTQLSYMRTETFSGTWARFRQNIKNNGFQNLSIWNSNFKLIVKTEEEVSKSERRWLCHSWRSDQEERGPWERFRGQKDYLEEDLEDKKSRDGSKFLYFSHSSSFHSGHRSPGASLV